MSQTDLSEAENSSTTAEEVIVDAEVLSEATSEAVPEEATPRPPSNLPKLIALIVVGFAILGGIFWSINQQFTQQIQQQTQQANAQGLQNSQGIQSLSGQISQLSGQVESQHNTTAGFSGRLKQQQQGFEKLQTRTQSSLQQQEQIIQKLLHSNREQSRQLNESVAALARRVDRRESNLHTAAALRLLQIAEEQLMIVRDLSTTQQALAQAGQQITASGDPILLPIHEQIQRELKQVRKTQTPDLPAALAQLREAIVIGATLPFDQPDNFEQIAVAPLQNKTDGWNWEAVANKVWSDLLTLIRIDKQEQELPVIASRSEAELSHLILRLRLEQAQSTLLMRDTLLFRERVQFAIDWLAIFDQSSPALGTLQQQLSQLLKLELQPQLPAIGEAHRRLREIVALRNSEKLESTEPETTAATEEAKP